MRRALLVALREYSENIRTKMFWVGVLMLPIMLIVGGVVPTLLTKTKDTRRYAVLDRSGFLSDAVRERALFADVLSLFENPKSNYTRALLSALPENATGDRLPTIDRFLMEAEAAAVNTPMMEPPL